MKLRGRASSMLWALAWLITGASFWRLGVLQPGTLVAAARRLGQFAASLVPPRTDILPTLLVAMGETLEIAFVGTFLGFLDSVPLAALAVPALVGHATAAAARVFIGALRTVPSILWGVIFVVAFGLGPAAGIFGVAAYTSGYLAKLYYEAFEAVDPEVFEAVRSISPRRLHLLRFAVLPEATNALLSQLLFMFEYNIRASAIMGFVGAGGIGYYMLGYLQMLQYRHLFSAVLLTFLVVMVVDQISLRLRAWLLPQVAMSR